MSQNSQIFLGEEVTKLLKKASEIGSTAVILDANLSFCTPNRLWLTSEVFSLKSSYEST